MPGARAPETLSARIRRRPPISCLSTIPLRICGALSIIGANFYGSRETGYTRGHPRFHEPLDTHRDAIDHCPFTGQVNRRNPLFATGKSIVIFEFKRERDAVLNFLSFFPRPVRSDRHERERRQPFVHVQTRNSSKSMLRLRILIDRISSSKPDKS